MAEPEHAVSPSASELIAKLAAAKARGYGKALPGELDRAFQQLAATYANAPSDERAAIRALVPDDARLLLIGFSDRFAILAARSQAPALLSIAAMAHSIEDFRHDDRENIIRLALIHHVAQKLGEAPDDVLSPVAALSSARSRP